MVSAANSTLNSLWKIQNILKMDIFSIDGKMTEEQFSDEELL
jgi:hypothetical protein